MVTNDFIEGYVMALDSLDSTLDEWIKVTNDYERDAISGYDDVKHYIKEQKKFYKKLVKELNEAQSKKTNK
jgi:hypothetical protein